MKKIVYILRSVPGSGKSTLAEHLSERKSSIICCADDYFTDKEGNYNWDPTKIGHAHLWCQSLFKKHLELGTDTIIVANTSTKAKDVNVYRKLALEFDYQVFVLTVENWHNGQDVHNVPDETKEIMKNQLLNSIKLLPNQ